MRLEILSIHVLPLRPNLELVHIAIHLHILASVDPDLRIAPPREHVAGQYFLLVSAKCDLLSIPVQLDMAAAALRQDLKPDVIDRVGLHIRCPLRYTLTVLAPICLVSKLDLLVLYFQRERDICTTLGVGLVFLPLPDHKTLRNST